MEWYFGYNRAHSDLTCEDWRSRDLFWDLGRHALEFFQNNSVPFWDMTNHNALLTTTNGWCLSQAGAAYVIFLKSAETTSLRLTNLSGEFTVQWFDPRNGGALQSSTVTQLAGGTTVSLGAPPDSSTNDWVAWVKLVVADTNAPSVIINSPPEGASLPGNLPVTVSATVTDDVAVASAQLWVDGSLLPPVLTQSPFVFSVTGLTVGEHLIAVAAEDNSGNRATNSVMVHIVAPAAPLLSLVSSGGLWQLVWTTPGFVLDHALAVTGPWTNVLPPALSPFPLRVTNAQEFFRLRWENP